MRETWNHWVESAGGASAVRRHALIWGLAAWIWFRPSNELTTIVMWLTGFYAVWNWRKTLAAWRNPAGFFFGLGVIWALLSVIWSFYPAGTARDLLEAAPLAGAVLAVPVLFDSPRRVWSALLVSAAWITANLGRDLIRLFDELGWPLLLREARFFHPYLYTHPNVSSMMAGLCVLVFAARWIAGAPGPWKKAALALGILLDLAYLVVMASRGPQLVFVFVALAFPLVLMPGWRARVVATILVVGVAVTLVEVVPRVNPRFRDRTMRNFSQRDTVWSHSMMLAGLRPVCGYGFGKEVFDKAVYANPEQRAPLVPFRYPHAHSYWIMLYFQGGKVGFYLWSLGWLALGFRLGIQAFLAGRAEIRWREKLRARALPVLLGTGMAFVLVYGIGDFPDQVIRFSQFCLAGLAVSRVIPLSGKEGGNA